MYAVKAGAAGVGDAQIANRVRVIETKVPPSCFELKLHLTFHQIILDDIKRLAFTIKV